MQSSYKKKLSVEDSNDIMAHPSEHFCITFDLIYDTF